ncbi:hypothetical protein D5E69_22930 (plasmid) [Rossellomorea marisflavi]|uniref:hypothetical protein n=1 Tax=Rossellomorea marisflavi TaxID=189381 RepID=UPI0013196F4F|nr:hypothetical protein [Rossellomorea marisflavi]QHA38692.1 hypothetical protein D5E69_22930 [Rossellomorea marisflavi]
MGGSLNRIELLVEQLQSFKKGSDVQFLDADLNLVLEGIKKNQQFEVLIQDVVNILTDQHGSHLVF